MRIGTQEKEVQVTSSPSQNDRVEVGQLDGVSCENVEGVFVYQGISQRLFGKHTIGKKTAHVLSINQFGATTYFVQTKDTLYIETLA